MNFCPICGMQTEDGQPHESRQLCIESLQDNLSFSMDEVAVLRKGWQKARQELSTIDDLLDNARVEKEGEYNPNLTRVQRMQRFGAELVRLKLDEKNRETAKKRQQREGIRNQDA